MIFLILSDLEPAEGRILTGYRAVFSLSYLVTFYLVKTGNRKINSLAEVIYYCIIIFVLYLTLLKIQISAKTNYKSHSLQLGRFSPNEVT